MKLHLYKCLIFIIILIEYMLKTLKSSLYDEVQKLNQIFKKLIG